jgi:hypothetical protein
MANPPKKKICGFQGGIPIILEAWGFPILGGSNGYEEIFLLLWILLD